MLAWGPQRAERLLLNAAGEPARGVGDGQHAAPVSGYRVSGQQRRERVGARVYAALDHQAAAGERPHADAGARAPAGRARDLARRQRAAVQLDEGLTDRESELGAGSEADMRGYRLDHADVGTGGQAEDIGAATGERERALSVGTLRREIVGRAGLDCDGRPVEGESDAAVATCRAARDVEHAEMQSCGRPDPDGAHCVRLLSCT